MIGLPRGTTDGRSCGLIPSPTPAWVDELEFFSIKAPSGRLTSRLHLIQPGDNVLLAKKPTGTLYGCVETGQALVLACDRHRPGAVAFSRP